MKTLFNIIFNGGRLNAFSLWSETREGSAVNQMFALTLLFHNILEVHSKIIRQENDIKCIHIGKEVKLHVFPNDMILTYRRVYGIHLKTIRTGKFSKG